MDSAESLERRLDFGRVVSARSHWNARSLLALPLFGERQEDRTFIEEEGSLTPCINVSGDRFYPCSFRERP